MLRTDCGSFEWIVRVYSLFCTIFHTDIIYRVEKTVSFPLCVTKYKARFLFILFFLFHLLPFISATIVILYNTCST